MTDTIVDNTYEATYYLMNGAKLVGVEFRHVPENKQKKLRYLTNWIMTMRGVSRVEIELWKARIAEVNVRDFEIARRKLKRMVDNFAKGRYEKS